MINFFCDFETNDTSYFTSASGSIQETTVKNGSYAGENGNNENFRRVLNTSYNTIYTGGYFYWDGDFGNYWFVIVAEGDSSQQFALRVMSTGKLKMGIPDYDTTAYNGNTVLQPNTWYKIEVEFYTHATEGWFKVKINGTVDIEQTGIDTLNGAGGGIDTIKWQGSNSDTVNCFVDDVYLRDFVLDDIGIKIAKDDVDTQSVDPGNIKAFSLNSNASLLKVKISAKVTIADGAGETIAHGLDYTPIVWVFMQNGSGNLVPVYDDTSGTYMYVDGTNLVIQNENGDSRDFYYYIFYDAI